MVNPSLGNIHVALVAFAVLGVLIGTALMIAGKRMQHAQLKMVGAGVFVIGLGIPILAELSIWTGISTPLSGGSAGAGVIASSSQPIKIELTGAQQSIMASCDRGQTQPQPTITLKNKFNDVGYATAGLWRQVKDAHGNDNVGGWQHFTSGTRIGVAITPDTEIEILFGNGTSAQFGQHVSWIVPCESNPTLNLKGVTSENGAGLTMTFLDSRGANAAEVPVASGQSLFFVEMRPGSREVYGNVYGVDGNGDTIYYPNELMITLNSSSWSSIDEVWIEAAPSSCATGPDVGCAGVALPQISTNGFATQNLVASGNLTKSFGLPAMENNGVYTIGIRATASSNPATADDSRIWVFAGNYFVYDNNAPVGQANNVAFGIVDRLNALVGLSQANSDSVQGNWV